MFPSSKKNQVSQPKQLTLEDALKQIAEVRLELCAADRRLESLRVEGNKLRTENKTLKEKVEEAKKNDTEESKRP